MSWSLTRSSLSTVLSPACCLCSFFFHLNRPWRLKTINLSHNGKLKFPAQFPVWRSQAVLSPLWSQPFWNRSFFPVFSIVKLIFSLPVHQNSSNTSIHCFLLMLYFLGAPEGPHASDAFRTVFTSFSGWQPPIWGKPVNGSGFDSGICLCCLYVCHSRWRRLCEAGCKIARRMIW